MSHYRVQLRNSVLAVVTRLGPEGPAPEAGPFVWLAKGTMADPVEAAPGNPQLPHGAVIADMWRADGRWREDGEEHPLDIVAGLEGSN